MAISVKKWAETHRKAWLKHAKTPLQIEFGNDKNVLWFYVESYNALNGINRGNFPSAKDITYADMLASLQAPNYEYMKDEFEMEGESQLFKLIQALHKKYGRMAPPRY